MKLTDVRLDDMPVNNSPYRIRSPTIGTMFIRDVLSGGYNVQPIPLPYSLLIVMRMISKAPGIIKTDILLILGYPTSNVPIKIGPKIFPNPPNSPGIIRKNIISNPCRVILIP
jgi:hypothetical protein